MPVAMESKILRTIKFAVVRGLIFQLEKMSQAAYQLRCDLVKVFTVF
jgi:hypothetical protein